MAITVDALTKSTNTTFQHTCSGDNRILVVAVSFIPTEEQETTSIKCNGQSLTFDYLQGGMGINLAVGYMISPPTGTCDIEVSITGSPSVLCTAMSLNGVSQIYPVWDMRSAVGHMVKDLPIYVYLRTNAMTIGIGVTNDITAGIEQVQEGQILQFDEIGNGMRAISISTIGPADTEMLLPNKLTKDADWGIFVLGIASS